MAITQISRIQVRSGRESETGLPQLATGELAWAVDTQKFYVGNGSVAEGAPAVGNTEILTQHSNILDFAETYVYKNSPNAVPRTIQDRLDDTVSVVAYGVVPDGETDCTVALQTAIDELYKMAVVAEGEEVTADNFSKRVPLVFPPGIFVVSAAIKVPPYATLIGAGVDKTVIRQIGSAPVFVTTNDTGSTDFAEFTYQNQPRNISIQGLTLEQTVQNNPVFQFHATRNSQVKQVKFVGNWNSMYPNVTEVGVVLTAKSSLVTSEHNVFDECVFEKLGTGIESSFDIAQNSITNCVFENCARGVAFGSNTSGQPGLGPDTGQQYGPRKNTVSKNSFSRINQQGVLIVRGQYNQVTNNWFELVGTQGGDDRAAEFAVIEAYEDGNVVLDNVIDRVVKLGVDPFFVGTYPYVSEFAGNITTEVRSLPLLNATPATASILFRLGATPTTRYVVHYTYKSILESSVRQGKLSIVASSASNVIQLADEFDVTGSPAAESLAFSAELQDLNADGIYETINIRYNNTDSGQFSYWYAVTP